MCKGFDGGKLVMKKTRGKKLTKRRKNRRMKNMAGELLIIVLLGCLVAYLVMFRQSLPADILCDVAEQLKDDSGDLNGDFERHIIEMKGISQEGMPTGCEAVSTIMALQYMGIEIEPEVFIDNYLVCKGFWKSGGVLYGPNPHKVFAGSPYEMGSLGCFSEVIVNAVEKMWDDGYPGMEEIEVLNVSGSSMEQLSKCYIAYDIPVVVWVTIGMQEPYDGTSYYLEDGSRYVWQAGEHCMVLCGFDENYYYLMDPLADGERVMYEKSLVEERYNEMGNQAVVIIKST